MNPFRGRGNAPCLLIMAALCTILPLSFGTPLAAQQVRVTVREDGAEGPRALAGAIVSLETDPHGPRIAPVLSNDDGVALIAAPAAGRYNVRVEFVGRAIWRSRPLDIPNGGVINVDALLPISHATLGTVVVRGESQCDLRDEQGGDVVAVWAEARKLLLASTLARPRNSAKPTLRVARFERLLDRNGRVEYATSDSSETVSAQPFVTAVSPEELSRSGYRMEDPGGDLFLAPDATVLLSEAFARDHCFSLVGSDEGQLLIGLAFRPQPRRKLADVAGTFWLDRSSGQLQRIDFRYVNVDPLVERAKAGGSVAFERIDGGGWIVSSWMVRTPRLGQVRSRGLGGAVSVRDSLFGAKEEGASVTVIERTVARGAAVDIEILVSAYDSTVDQPLAGVRASIAGTSIAAVGDSSGHVRLLARVTRPVTVTLDHPRFRLLRLSPRVNVAPAGSVRFNVAYSIPSRATTVARLCSSGAGSGTVTALVGRVTTTNGGALVPLARVTASWRMPQTRVSGRTIATTYDVYSLEAITDEAGTYLLCDLPRDRSFELSVDAVGHRPFTSRLSASMIVLREETLQLRPCEPDDDERTCPQR